MTDSTFAQLDYLYTPSHDVAADLEYFTSVLGGRLVFAIEGMGTRVAMIELTDGPPRIVLSGHLEGERPILVYRVESIDDATRELEARGWRPGHALEIPQGPVRSFTTPGGHRLAIYELTRPGVIESFAGRRDF
jgi:glyoxalase/bleomycin resistance protein/dioxygenase superfamily protein